MYRVLAVFVLATALLAPSVDAQTMGVYFDAAGMHPSWGDSTTEFPCSREAFLIAKGTDPAAGIDGWECSLSWSDSLYVTLSEIYGQNINVGTTPSYIVGLAAPLGIGSDMVVLARFSIVALGPGDIWLDAASPCSIPQSTLPILLSGQSLWPVALEYGGLGDPCASVGSEIAVQNSGTLEFVSQFESIIFQDGHLYGYRAGEKSGTQLPRFDRLEDVDLAEGDLAVLSLVPEMTGVTKGIADKSVTLMSEGFENYFANVSPVFNSSAVGTFQPTGGAPVANFYTHSGDNPFELGFTTYWGVTTTRAAPGGGTKSAYCNACYKICSDWVNWTGCQVYTTTTHELYPSQCNYLQSGYFAVSQSGNCRIRGQTWTDMNGYESAPLSYDRVEIILELFDGYTRTWTAIGVIWWNGVWVPVNMSLGNLPMYVDASVVFKFRAANSSWGGAGAYVDNLSVVSYDIDLSIASAYAYPSNSADDPVAVTLTVENNGAEPSGNFAVAYSRGGTQFNPTAIEHSQVVSSIDPGWSRDVVVSVPYRANGDKFMQTIADDIHFMLDPSVTVVGGDIAETDESNNTRSLSAYWYLSNAPVILVHGFLGSELKKTEGATLTSVFGADVITDIESMVLKPERLRRSTDTNSEESAAPMYTPSAYPPANGFMRGFRLSVPLLFTRNESPNGLLSPAPSASIPVMGDLWRPLIENLTYAGQGEGYVLPDYDPIQEAVHTQDLFLFNYDWRLDQNPSRNRSLNGSSSAYARLDSLVTWIKQNHPGSDRLTVVSHSMGGLLVEAYIRSRPTTHGISRWISMGSPFQGSETAMASLLGYTDAINLRGAGLASRTIPDMFQEFPSLWELLPTTTFDAEAPALSWWWPDHRPYWYDGGASHCPYFCRGIGLPLSGPFISAAQLKQSTGAYGTWYHNLSARQYAGDMQNLYMNMLPAEQISGVDTWLIVGKSEKSTLRGVARYGFQMGPPDQQVSIYRDIAHAIVRGPGDKFVSPWSASTVNVAPSNLHVRFASNVDHMGLLQDQTVGNFVGDLIRGRDLSTYDFSLPSTEPGESNSEVPWYIRWHTDAALIIAKDGGEKSTEFAGMPVTLELVQLDPANPNNNRVLVGLAHPETPIGDPGDPQSVSIVMDPRFSVSEIQDDLIIDTASTDLMHLRLYIRPNPALWEPDNTPPVGAETDKSATNFVVLGHLFLRDVNYTFAFPSEEYTDQPYLKFTSNGTQNFGFSAYVDFTIQNGDVPSGMELTLYADGDGDGVPEMQVSGVRELEDLPTAHGDEIACSPNPFNGGAFFEWSLSDRPANRIEVYDTRGRRVLAKEIDGRQQGREYFDGRDQKGRALPSGVYLVVLKDDHGESRARATVTLLK